MLVATRLTTSLRLGSRTTSRSSVAEAGPGGSGGRPDVNTTTTTGRSLGLLCLVEAAALGQLLQLLQSAA